MDVIEQQLLQSWTLVFQFLALLYWACNSLNGPSPKIDGDVLLVKEMDPCCNGACPTDSWWGISDSPFGRFFVVVMQGTIRQAGFIDSDSRFHSLDQLRISRNDHCLDALCIALFQEGRWDYPLHLEGTPFQRKVWDAVSAVPVGMRITYGDLACKLGIPKSVRAVASAVARNPVALFIPCHRIIPAGGGAGQYRWGASRKLALLEWERTSIF